MPKSHPRRNVGMDLNRRFREENAGKRQTFERNSSLGGRDRLPAPLPSIEAILRARSAFQSPLRKRTITSAGGDRRLDIGWVERSVEVGVQFLAIQFILPP